MPTVMEMQRNWHGTTNIQRVVKATVVGKKHGIADNWNPEVSLSRIGYLPRRTFALGANYTFEISIFDDLFP